MEYADEWQKCHLTKEETTLLCPTCGLPSNIKIMKKTVVGETKENLEVVYVCKKCYGKEMR